MKVLLKKFANDFYKNLLKHITMADSLLISPASVRGQKSLNRKAFKIALENIPCVILDQKLLQNRKSVLKKYMLKLKNFKPVSYENDKALVYLDPRIFKTQDLTLDAKEVLEFKRIELNYDNWSPNEVLKAILPPEIEVPKSFSQIGHILHLNLRDEQLPYKKIIAEVFLDKVPNTRTVVNKLNIIDTVYRQFEMEILAGDTNTDVEVKENNCRFRFDFAKVYWNPRLGAEHTNLVNLIKEFDVLYDVFAGVGPFSIPAGKKKVRVLANDLNAQSYKALLSNIKLNKVEDYVTAFNMDGREFIETEIKKDILKRRKEVILGREHITMNLPASAVEFLGTFSSWTENHKEISSICSGDVVIHVYCFVKAEKQEDTHALAISLVEEKLKRKLRKRFLIETKYVRNVAPNKEMMRVSFLLSQEILETREPKNKKFRPS